MLLLTRRTNESIIIGNNEITITILGIYGNHIRIGIDAPKSISVHRKEIFLKVNGEGACLIKPNQLVQSRKHFAVN